MATTIERPRTESTAPAAGGARLESAGWVLAAVATALALWALGSTVAGSPTSGQVVRDCLILVWAAAGTVLGLRRGWEAPVLLILAAAGVAAVGSLVDSFRPVALALMPAAGMHFLLMMPEDSLRTTARRVLAVAGYGGAVAVAAVLWAQRPDYPKWPAVAELMVAAVIGLPAFAGRYARAGMAGRRRMKWLGWAGTAAGAVSVVALGLHALVDWPTHVGEIAAGMTALIPLALVLDTSKRLAHSIDALLAHSISLAGLTTVVVAVYLAIVLGLGRVPHKNERTLLVLSMVAAGVAALMYLPAHSRLRDFARRLVYGGREVPDEVLRTFGSRLSRAIPLDELLLQMAESLRKTLALNSAEVWMASGGTLERAVSDPEKGPAKLTITSAEEATISRAGVSGPAWVKVWLPDLLAGREGSVLRVAPITHSGELLGIIVVERPVEAEQFGQEDERTLTELARQVGLSLHNVRLDSALQASLDQVRRQAEALQASRARIVATADAERRRIERNIHDGAQQQLVALAVKVRLARQLAEKESAKAEAMLEEVGHNLEDALQDLRDLAHGIYPPLLADKGLPEALASAARRATLPVEVRPAEIGRYSLEVEAAVYFCCLEALQNAGKYAGEGARATIRLWEEAGGLLFEVEDDGAGFDVHHRPSGAGFTNMNDRLGAIGGSLRVESAPGQGTKIHGTIPIRERAGATERA